jgi:DUF4097 and DUF4098 domain-containing protein YvlB
LKGKRGESRLEVFMRRVFPLVLPLFAIAAPVFAAEIGSFDRTLNVSGPVDLDIENSSGRVTVRPGDTSTVRVHAVISSWDGAFSADTTQRAREIEANPPIRQTGNSIRIDRIDDRHISIAYDLVVPAQTRLQSKTGSGAQSVEGIQGPVTATAGSGGIQVARIDDTVTLQSGSGGIEFDSIKGRVEATTGSGGVRGANLSGPITAHAGSGGITLRLAGSTGFDVHAQTGSGQIYVNPPITMQSSSFGRHEVRGQIRGGGPAIDVTSGSGGVRIE